MSPDTARMIEQATGHPKYWLDGDAPGSSVISPMAQRLAKEFDGIRDDTRQATAFIKIMELIEIAASHPVPAEEQLAQRPRIRRPARL